ncbi:MAG: Crp/Fnr family transcriptional regulator [Thiotrichaceae bacterium]
MPLDPKFHEIMRQNPLFKDLSDSAFLRVTEHTSHCELKTDEVLFRQQEPATDFFMLLTGKMKLSLLSFEGTEKVVDIINPVNTFAEAIIFRGIPGYPVNAEALSDTTVLRIEAATYIETLENSPKVCFKVMAALSVRIHWLMNELDRLSLHNATYRLITYLLETVPEDIETPTEVHLSVPKHVIASRISVTPETFSRTLKGLSKQGLVTIHNSHLVLNNPAELRKMVSI